MSDFMLRLPAGRAHGIAESEFELREEVIHSGRSMPPTVAGFAWLVRELGIGARTEVWAAAVDEDVVWSVACVARGPWWDSDASVSDLLALPLLVGTDRLVLITTRPAGPLQPSPDDLSLTVAVATAAIASGLWLDDHLLVGGNGRVLSLRATGRLA